MAYRRSTLAMNEYYHLYNRGADKREIFKDNTDRFRFIELLFLSNSTKAVNIRDVRNEVASVFEYDRGTPLVAIGAYCLMPNHFHILATPLEDDGIQTFMRKVSTGYSMYFNKRYERTGVLFQGRYKSQHAHDDEYLKYLFSYIHLNPVKLIQPNWKEVGVRDLEQARMYLGKYKYSSLSDYFRHRPESVIIEPNKFPDYFKGRKEVDEEILEWLTYRKFVEGNT